MTTTVAIEDLKVGMFVHLDLGWWAHPFALSSFMITEADQVATLRGLGLKRLRWSPDKSRIALPDAPAAPAAPSPFRLALDERAAAPAANDTGARAADAATADDPVTANHADGTNGTDGPASGGPGRCDAPAGLEQALAANERENHAHRVQLAAQRRAAELCAAQLSEARAAYQQASLCLAGSPEQAHAIAQGLTRAMLDKLLATPEVCVRVLADAGGEPDAAHALNVMVISLMVGRVCGLDAQTMQDMGLGALLHDIGKLDLPDRLRHEKLCLQPAEQSSYRSHVGLGLAQGRRLGLSAGAMQVLAQHHELADGSGFPAGQTLDDMGLAARIVALVNRYDNLCNPRQPGLALTPHEALSTLFSQARGRYDPVVVQAFIRLMGVYPPGTLVQLSDGRFAEVVSVNPTRPLKPRVLVCDTHLPVDEVLLLDLDTEPGVGVRRSLKASHLPAEVRDHLVPKVRMVYFFEPVALDVQPEQVAA